MAWPGLTWALPALAWLGASAAGALVLWREVAPHVRRALTLLRACQAWPGESLEHVRRRVRRELLLVAAAGAGAMVAWPVLLWLTAPGAVASLPAPPVGF